MTLPVADAATSRSVALPLIPRSHGLTFLVSLPAARLQTAHLAAAGRRRRGNVGRNSYRDDWTKRAALFADIAEVVRPDHLVVLRANREAAEDGVEGAAAHNFREVDGLDALRLLDSLEDDLHAHIGLAFEIRRLRAFVLFLPARDEYLVLRRVERRAVVDDAPDAFGNRSHGLHGAVGHETHAGNEHLVEDAEIVCLRREVDGVAACQRHPEAFGARRFYLLDERGIIVRAERGVDFGDNFLVVHLGRLGKAVTGIATPGDVAGQHCPLGLLARRQPRPNHRRVLGVLFVHAEYPRHAGITGQLIALVDRRDVERIPAPEQRSHCQGLAGRDCSRQNPVTLRGELLGLLARDLGLRLAVEDLDFDLAAIYAALRIHLFDGKLDGAQGFLAETGIGAGQRRRHADPERFLSKRR